jgi:hypothetical protein
MSAPTTAKEQFSFEISLNVLNHLGRNLYRSFVTVLGEAISNSWDANAENVWIYIDRDKNNLVVKDDGDGMSGTDFQNKFLKIGYTKRKDGSNTSTKGRPYIGRKGIGKLALLSCADKISVISKTNDQDYVGGMIDNSGLDKAITDDLTPEQYPLGDWEPDIFSKYSEGHEHGTIIYFENVKDGIKSNLDYLKKAIALYFRFSLIDESFNIFIDGEKITNDNLSDLAKKTEFLWNINDLKDPYINDHLTDLKEHKTISFDQNIKGFIASVGKPADLKVISTTDKVSVDLFVNGRLREKDILKHIPTARVVESYLYGQIHFDELDDKEDRFTSSREGVIADDSKYKEFLEGFRSKVLNAIMEDWDKWRRKHKKDGDPENPELSTKQRKAEELFNAVSEEYELPKEDAESKKIVDSWVDSFSDDAKFNFVSYAECFISENILRTYIEEKKIPLSESAQKEIDKLKNAETQNKSSGNINIDLRQKNSDLSYLDMQFLAHLVEKPGTENCLPVDSKQYRPIRDALMHTSRLTHEAKVKLTSVYENIKGRIRKLLTTNLESQTKMDV